ncbi:VOC family protein [Neptunomonas antarctica]|uniref:Aldoketomutase n=1 Tax=Neptunomonas antarctica TaxID=619304 RepID=A0A1N7K072_9GAMM|nr:VOC family protein [Neptunomonas antarctica]SIS54989.1 lactoylglutathione lyase [Neptunomonas antarctica]
MAKAIHTMIRVFDLDRSISFYKQALKLEVADRLDFDGFSLVYLRNDENDFELELTHNHDQSDRYTHGTGYGHLAVCIEDIRSTHSHLLANSLKPADIKEFHREGNLMARFFFLVDPDGYKIEFIERHGRFK